jgi:hypothetical protein
MTDELAEAGYTITPTVGADGPARERVARRLHAILAPRGEDTGADWEAMNPLRRRMYLTNADSLITLVRAAERPAAAKERQ